MKLTKTGYLIYLDAPRHLWAYANGKTNEQSIDSFLMHLYDQGKQVQTLAREYIKKHLIPDYYKGEKNVGFEETKSDQNFEARIDFIAYNQKSKKWDIYEIKSSKRVKKEHYKDLAFQYLVFRKHYEIGSAYVLHLDGEYTRHGDLSLTQLFTRTNITNEIKDILDEVHEERYQALDTMRLKNAEDCASCIKPKTCPCLDLCHPNLPEYSIYDVRASSRNRRRTAHLEENYSKSIDDIPSDSHLGKGLSFSDKQRDQIKVAQSGETHIDKDAILQHISELEYPLYFLDYESFNPAVPLYDGYTPYDQMPFQYSLHVLREDGGELEHHEFIETKKVDPSVGLLDSLKDVIGESGSVVIWSKFERTQNNGMAKRYLQHSDFIEGVNQRLWDLMEPFQQQWFNLRNFKGRYSIKNVLPVLVPGFSYDELAINNGAVAMTKWVQMVYGGGITAQYFGEGTEDVVDIPTKKVDMETGNDLLEYCKMDTFAMVKLLQELKGGWWDNL